jgi:hypothetical protein
MSSRDIIRKHWKSTKWQSCTIIIAAVISFLLVVADYAIQNYTFPLFDDVSKIALFDYLLGNKIEKKKKFFNEDSVTYVNFAKDKVLVPVKDIFGHTIGSDVITNRETLLRFLELADSSDYKYIFLDVRFEKGYETPYDSALFARIETMPRLIIATHRKNGNYEIADKNLLSKAAYADYRGPILSGFTRYEFLQDHHRSVALQMLYDIDKQDITKCWYGYRTGKWPCYNLKYIPFPHYLFKGDTTNVSDFTFKEKIRYPYAGSMILNRRLFSTEDVIKNLLNDKIIVAGDFDNDLHGTYVGEIPGPVLSFAAYQYLHAGLHKVQIPYLVFLFILYFIIIYLIFLSGDHIANFIENKPVLHFFLSLFSLTSLFLIVKIILYGCFLISMVMIVPSLAFWVVSIISYTWFEREIYKNNNQG